jgi:hypothetical protein
MLFPEVVDAIADLIVMTAQAESRFLPEFIDSLNPADAAAADRQGWNRTLLALIGESRLRKVNPENRPRQLIIPQRNTALTVIPARALTDTEAPA